MVKISALGLDLDIRLYNYLNAFQMSRKPVTRMSAPVKYIQLPDLNFDSDGEKFADEQQTTLVLDFFR